MADKSENVHKIDVNDPEFYNKIQDVVESDIARMKKSIEVALNLRLRMAEIEVETAALYHAEFWHEVLKMEISETCVEIISDDDYDSNEFEEHDDPRNDEDHQEVPPRA